MARKSMSQIKGTIGNTLYNNIVEINQQKDKKSLDECLKRILGDRTDKDAIDFFDSLEGLNYEKSMKYVYNYLFAGDGCRSIKI